MVLTTFKNDRDYLRNSSAYWPLFEILLGGLRIPQEPSLCGILSWDSGCLRKTQPFCSEAAPISIYLLTEKEKQLVCLVGRHG